jgi:hypothetical protein
MHRGMRLIVVLTSVIGISCNVIAARAANGRVFEQVSPPYKGGFGVLHIEGVGQDGNGVAYYSPGAFAGARAGLSSDTDFLDYLANRGATGWSTTPATPPDELMPSLNGHNRDISITLHLTLALGKVGPSLESAFQAGTEEKFLLYNTELPDLSSNWEQAGITLKTLTNTQIVLLYLGGSNDFCHLLFEAPPANGKGLTEILLPQAIGTTGQIYELVSGCSGEPAALRLVGLNDNGRVISPLCKVEAGIEDYNLSASSAFNAIAGDGSEVFFTTCIANEVDDHQLFVRLNGERTIEVSKALTDKCGQNEIPCAGAVERASADFAGASEDGSKVFFTTHASLDEGKKVGNDLYMATIGCSSGGSEDCSTAARRVTSLVRVSHDPSGDEAAVQGVVRIAPDGSRVYFVAGGDLLTASEETSLRNRGRAVPKLGADNLYVYDSVSGQVEFIGDLCSGPEQFESGSIEDTSCPSAKGIDTGLWVSNSASDEAQTAGQDGRYLVFSSYAQLDETDTDASRDVYRFDAVTGEITRISVGENGYHENGNGAFDATIAAGHKGGSVRWQHELDTRTISDDGSRIIFTSAEPLSPRATNDLANVYEWHISSDGHFDLSLISGGTASTPVEDAVIAFGGTDIFFLTTESLVPQDIDVAPDIYDARIGGGFPSSSTPREQCSSDACQGPLTLPAPLVVPGTLSLLPEQMGVVAQKTQSSKTKKSKVPKRKRKKRKRLAHSRGGRNGNSGHKAKGQGR